MNKASSLRHWSLKFRNAFRGMRVGMLGQTSFYAHSVISLLVFVAAIALHVTLLEWCVLLLCIGLVLTAELMNSSLECFGKAITDEFDEDIRDALDIASGAVLIASISAAIVGATILIFRLGLMVGLWGGYLLI